MEKLARWNAAFFAGTGGTISKGNTLRRIVFQLVANHRAHRRSTGLFNSRGGYWSGDGMGLDEYLPDGGALPARSRGRYWRSFAGYTLNGTSRHRLRIARRPTCTPHEPNCTTFLDPQSRRRGARMARGHTVIRGPSDVRRDRKSATKISFSSTYGTPGPYPSLYGAIHAQFPASENHRAHTTPVVGRIDISDEPLLRLARRMQEPPGFLWTSRPRARRGGVRSASGASMEGSRLTTHERGARRRDMAVWASWRTPTRDDAELRRRSGPTSTASSGRRT
jgi:hypothetical protein